MDTSSLRMSTYGYVSDREIVSTSRASQTTLEREWCARLATLTRPRYEVRPPPRATDSDTIVEEVCGARCSILAPASWCWPAPANATDRTSPWAGSPIRKTDGYFIVTLGPMLPSTHSMVAPSSALARLVTRL